MTLEHLVEIALLIVPTIIFITLIYHFNKLHNTYPTKERGGELILRSFEGVTAIALLLSMASDPTLIINVGEFRGMLGALALIAIWNAFAAIVDEMKNKN